MKICINGVIRDMTPEEIAAMQQGQPTEPEMLTTERKLELMLAAIPEAPMPDMEPKLGYKWQPMYTPSSGFAWELVEDPTALGTAKNPWYWLPGAAVKMGHHYTPGGSAVLLAVQDGIPPAWADSAWFEDVRRINADD